MCVCVCVCAYSVRAYRTCVRACVRVYMDQVWVGSARGSILQDIEERGRLKLHEGRFGRCTLARSGREDGGSVCWKEEKTAPRDLPTSGADYPYLKTVRRH